MKISTMIFCEFTPLTKSWNSGLMLSLLSPDLTNDLRDMTEMCVNGLFLHEDNCMFCIICTCTYNIPVKCRMVLFK